MTNFKVGTGIVFFDVTADSPAQAIQVLKDRIQTAGQMQFFDAQRAGMSYSIVEALREGRLNFIVLNESRTDILCGEYQGEFQELTSRELLDSLDRLVPDGLRMKQLQKLHASRLSL